MLPGVSLKSGSQFPVEANPEGWDEGPVQFLERVVRERDECLEQLAQPQECLADPVILGGREGRIPPSAVNGETHQHADGMVWLQLAVGRENVFLFLARGFEEDRPTG